MSFFMSADYSLSTKVMEIIYFIIGLLCIYCGVKNLKDKENPEPMGTFIFWAVLGVVLALGRWLPSLVSGILVVVMCIPAILKKVKKGAVSAATKAETEATYEKIGMKIFVPTLSIGMLAVICAITGMGIGLSALNGVALGVLVAIILLMIMNRDNKPSTFLNDSERMLSTVGPLSMLPMLLACLGSVFTAAGVGDVISDLVSHIIPEGNVNAGIVVYAIGMMLFTMIMGNAYAAITVMTVGIGYPFVLAHGANPVHRHAGFDLRLLRHPVHPHGCKLQHRARGTAGYEEAHGRHQESGSCRHHHDGGPDRDDDPPEVIFLLDRVIQWNKQYSTGPMSLYGTGSGSVQANAS